MKIIVLISFIVFFSFQTSVIAQNMCNYSKFNCEKSITAKILRYWLSSSKTTLEDTCSIWNDTTKTLPEMKDLWSVKKHFMTLNGNG